MHKLLCSMCHVLFMSTAVQDHLEQLSTVSNVQCQWAGYLCSRKSLCHAQQCWIVASKPMLLSMTAVHIGMHWATGGLATHQCEPGAQAMLTGHLSAAFLILESMAFIYSATKTCVLRVVLLIAPAWVVGMVGLNTAPHLLDWPNKVYWQNLHWSEILRSVPFSGFTFPGCAATSRTVFIA